MGCGDNAREFPSHKVREGEREGAMGIKHEKESCRFFILFCFLTSALVGGGRKGLLLLLLFPPQHRRGREGRRGEATYFFSFTGKGRRRKEVSSSPSFPFLPMIHPLFFFFVFAGPEKRTFPPRAAVAIHGHSGKRNACSFMSKVWFESFLKQLQKIITCS